MQHTIKSLIGFTMAATDGEIGNVTAFYFDDETWAIRYLVVETGNWFSNKKVLIAPQAVQMPDWSGKNFPVNLTIEQIKSSPDIDTDQPVSNQQEIDMYGHYAWARYGGGGFYAGASAAVTDLPTEVDEEIIKENAPLNGQDSFDPHLRSTEVVTGYYVHAEDGDIGHIKDFVLEGDSWKITDLEIDTHNWIGGRKVLMPVRHVKEIQWENYKIMLDVSIEFINDTSVFKEATLAAG